MQDCAVSFHLDANIFSSLPLLFLLTKNDELPALGVTTLPYAWPAPAPNSH
jgi:hypothetical protein